MIGGIKGKKRRILEHKDKVKRIQDGKIGEVFIDLYTVY